MIWKKILPKFVVRQWDELFKKAENALVYFTPAYLPKNNSWFTPIIAIVSLILAVILIGIAMGSFFTLFSSLLVLYFILTKIFGIRLEAGDVFVM